jgi:hypothetical protein
MDACCDGARSAGYYFKKQKSSGRILATVVDF